MDTLRSLQSIKLLGVPVLLDDVALGEGSIVGALAMVKAGTEWPARSLVVGNPAMRKGEVSDSMLAHKKEGTALYQALPGEAALGLEETTALRVAPEDRLEDFPDYDTWQSRKSK